MRKSVIAKRYFYDEKAAFAKLESILWPDGPVCPKCGGEGYPLKGVKDKKGRVRLGLKKCRACRAQFTVRVGTVFESSHVPLHKWFQAVHLICSSKKGISSHQLHRVLEVTYKTAWFMSHRIREAMRSGDLDLFGGPGTIVESDETFIGTDKAKVRGRRGGRHKMKVHTLIDRETGRARSQVIKDLKISTVMPIVMENVRRETTIVTDDAGHYKQMGDAFPHETVNHSADEWARGPIHTNTVEGYFSVFKRGMRGVYQHCSKKHLHRYLAEFDFRYGTRAAVGVDDESRTIAALCGIVGKRLTYRDSSGLASRTPV